MPFLNFIYTAIITGAETVLTTIAESTRKYRKKKNLYFIVPTIAIGLALFLPGEFTTEYFYGGATGISCAAMLYRYRWIAEFMHRKPTYIESATTFKTHTGRVQTETFDERLVHEVDYVLTRRFRSVFIHVIIFIDSVCVGILGYWVCIHMEGKDPDHWIKNLGFLGGYLMFFKQIHYYSGKLVLWLLKKRKKTAHAAEIRRRRSNSDNSVTQSPIIQALNNNQGRTIPIVKSLNNFSLCGQEISHHTEQLGDLPPLDLNSV
jgi:hypothetical protein